MHRPLTKVWEGEEVEAVAEENWERTEWKSLDRRRERRLDCVDLVMNAHSRLV